MFETLPNPSLATLFIVLRGVLLIGAFWVFAIAFSRWRRTDEQASQALQAQLERTFNEVRSLHETIAVMNARIESLSERSESEPRFAPASPLSATRGYDLATRLAKNGVGIDELVATCGITRNEAELLTRLHGAAHREPAPRPRPAPQAAPASEPVRQRVIEQPPPPAPSSGRKRGSLLSVVG